MHVAAKLHQGEKRWKHLQPTRAAPPIMCTASDVNVCNAAGTRAGRGSHQSLQKGPSLMQRFVSVAGPQTALFSRVYLLGFEVSALYVTFK